jgi:hypothetical protein
VVTHTNILASVRSTRLSNPASLLNGTLSYRMTKVMPAASVISFAPLNFRRTATID